jgi:hypothetical protein
LFFFPHGEAVFFLTREARRDLRGLE